MMVLLNSVLDSKMIVKFTGFNTNDLGKRFIYIPPQHPPLFYNTQTSCNLLAYHVVIRIIGGENVSLSTCSVFEVFLAVLVGVGLLLLSVLGVIGDLLVAINLAGAAGFISGLIGVIGLLAVLLFAYCIFRRIWRCCFGSHC
jgi:hypothetical protein